MSLFFDQAWYDARLSERGLTRAVLAITAGLDEAELVLAWKDQRELSLTEVAAFAELLGVSRDEAASRAGMRPRPPSEAERIVALEARVAELEARLGR